MSFVTLLELCVKDMKKLFQKNKSPQDLDEKTTVTNMESSWKQPSYYTVQFSFAQIKRKRELTCPKMSFDVLTARFTFRKNYTAPTCFGA